MEPTMNVNDLQKLCDKHKERLIKKARARGIGENFGAKETREVDEASMSIAHDGSLPMEDRKRAGQISMSFNDWVTTYQGEM